MDIIMLIVNPMNIGSATWKLEGIFCQEKMTFFEQSRGLSTGHDIL